MHPTQQEILNSLRKDDSRKFNDLLQDVAETSDNLTYHLKQLQKGSFIESQVKGQYTLAQKGLIYLNNNLELNYDLFPTVSCMLELYGSGNTTLVMCKLKQPYLGTIHLPTFGVTSLNSLQEQIDNFLERYHIMATNLAFRGVHRERTAGENGNLVFDKFFMVFRGNFSAFKEHIGDREFAAIHTPKLVDNPQLLSASRTILLLGPEPNFTENTEG